MKKVIFILSSLVLLLGSCIDHEKKEQERQRSVRIVQLKSDLADYQPRLNLLKNSLTNEESKLVDFSRRKFQLESELTDYERKVEAYLMNHKMAVASIVAGFGGSAVAMDTSNEFTTEMKEVAAIVGVIGAVYALFNMDEIIEVGDVLMQADTNVKNIERAIDNVQHKVRFTKTSIRNKELKVNELETVVFRAKAELRELSF